MGLLQIAKNRQRILGLNTRYLEYIRPYNLKPAIEVADNKLLTKRILEQEEIPTPKLIATVLNHRELEEFDFSVLPKSFVIKPVRGIEGGGIEIFFNKVGDAWVKADGSRVDEQGMRNRMSDIIDGRYSLHNQPDSVMIEERIKSHKNFRYYSYKGGAPDVRVIVFNSIPIMSYVRLPTKESDGKGNLALGAIGAAIDIAAGRVTTSIAGKHGAIEYVPGTNIRLSGLRIPYWNRILEYAIKAHRATKLGFAAVDFLIDREQGPMIVELNARPGLSIQLANQDGLKWRLERARGLKVTTVSKGIRLGKDLFGGEIEESVENITGKQVLGILEDITVYGPGKEKEELKAKVDTGADSTSIDRKLLERLGFRDTILQYDEFIAKELENIDIKQLPRGEAGKLADELTEKVAAADIGVEKVVAVYSSHGVSFRPYLQIEIELSGIRFETLCSVYDRSKLKYSVIVGKKSLYRFLVDPSK